MTHFISRLANLHLSAIIAMIMAKSHKDDIRPVAVNKKAYRDFILVERFEAGLNLLGSEVKSLRNAAADLSGSYAKIEDGQCWLVGATIAQYEQAGIHNHEPTRKRKLLLHKSEIRKLWTKLEQRGFTLVPLRIYFSKRSLAKIELALAHGKRKYDKRKSITEREQKRDVDRDLRKYK
jgi:SsrA-binding protein